MPNCPEKYFTRSNFKKQYRLLASEHHPDLGGDPKVFAEITTAYNAVKKYADNDWMYGGIDIIDGVTFNYLLKEPFELGTVYILGDKLLHRVDPVNADLLSPFELGSWLARPYKDATKKEFAACIPLKTYLTMQGVVVDIPTGYLRLKDVQEHQPLIDRHVAWIVSRLLNLCCWLSHTGVVHNAISTENVFIDPANHKVALLGGWFYSVRQGAKLLALPKKTVEFGPSSLLRDKVGSTKTDLEMVKVLARELVGTNAPKAMLDYLNLPASDDARKEFKYWYDVVLTEAFGPKKFVELKVGNLYKTGE